MALADTPPILKAAMNRDIGRYALPGQPFDDHDVVTTGVSRRLVWIRKRDTRWAIAVEVGGKAPFIAVLAYEMGYDGSLAVIRVDRAFPPTVCQVTERQLWR